MRIGILDIQGSVAEHFKMLRRVREQFKDGNFEIVLVKKVEDFENLSGLILPGGESTTLGKLLRKFGLRDEITCMAKEGRAIWGTCAGAILMSKEIEGQEKADVLGLMDVSIERNAYGRQLESFEGELEFDFGVNENEHVNARKNIPAVFIRAPKIKKVGAGVRVLAKNQKEIVAARQGNLLITTFHPEMGDDLSVHEYFVKIAEGL